MEKKITVEEFISEKEAELDFFFRLIKYDRECDKTIPEKLTRSGWDKQFSLWMEQ